MTPEHLNRCYEKLLLIRRVEERIIDIYDSDKIKSPVHLSIGQESVSVGVCEALAPGDVVFGTYRSHALYLAKGGDLNAMIAELFGKASGCGGGKAGSMHLGAPEIGMLGTSAIVATSIPHAVGFAWARRQQGSDAVVCAFFGDGALEEGVFHESLNFAALHKLPVLFVCENNLYAIHTPFSRRVPQPNFCERATACGAESQRIEQGDMLAIHQYVGEALPRLRGGSGPVFLEVETYRWREHVGPGEDWDLGFRDRSELAPWVENDQLPRIGSMLEPGQQQRIDQSVERQLDAAFEQAESAEFPAPEALFADVYAT